MKDNANNVLSAMCSSDWLKRKADDIYVQYGHHIDLSYLGAAFCEIDWFHHTAMPWKVNDTCRLIWLARLVNVPIETADLWTQLCYCFCRLFRLWEMIYTKSAEEINNETDEILQRAWWKSHRILDIIWNIIEQNMSIMVRGVAMFSLHRDLAIIF